MHGPAGSEGIEDHRNVQQPVIHSDVEDISMFRYCRPLSINAVSTT